MNTTNITIDTTIDASIEQVWAMYNAPTHITNWNFASDDWHCPHASNDLREGGKYVARMEAKDGSYGFDFSATYDEIIPHQRLAYTLEDNRKVTITFSKIDNATKVETVFAAEPSQPIDMQKAGWQAILNNFKKYVENNS